MRGLLKAKRVLGKGIKVFDQGIPCFLMFLWLLPFMTVTKGCVTAIHPVANSVLYVETIPSSRVELSNIHLRQEGLTLMVSGEVARRNAAFSGIGHIDVAVVSPDGSLVGQGNAGYSPRILPKTPGARKHRPSRFELRIQCDPPAGSIVRLAYHGTPSHSEPLQSFQENYAVPEDHDYGS